MSQAQPPTPKAAILDMAKAALYVNEVGIYQVISMFILID